MKRGRIARLKERQERKGFSAMRHMEMRKAQLRSRTTRHEWMMRELLDWLQYKYIFQKGFIDNGKIMIADFYLPKPYRVVIEIDGSSHTSHADKVKDAIRDAFFQERNCRVLRITNQEMETLTGEELRRLIGPKKRSQVQSLDEHEREFSRLMREHF